MSNAQYSVPKYPRHRYYARVNERSNRFNSRPCLVKDGRLTVHGLDIALFDELQSTCDNCKEGVVYTSILHGPMLSMAYPLVWPLVKKVRLDMFTRMRACHAFARWTPIDKIGIGILAFAGPSVLAGY